MRNPMLAPVLGLALALGLSACGRTSEAEHVAQSPAADERKRPDPIVVTVTPAAARSVERTVSVVGTLDANQHADLASETEGQVMAVRSDLGDRVARGQVLLEVRSDVIEAQLQEAEAGLEKAAADESRAAPLRAQGIIADQEYQKMRTELRVAQARRDRLRIEYERAHVRAPFDGSVSARLSNLGDYVRPGTVVFRLVQDDPLTFRGEVPERDVPALKAGQAMRITVDPYPGETFAGTVTRVGAASDPAARSLAFEAAVPNRDRRLRPGFFGHGEVVIRREERAVAVPRAAVTTFAGVTKVFVVEDGIARERAVTLGVDLGDGWIEVTEGVGRGLQVVTSGLSRLADGTPVTVRDDVEPNV